MVCYWMKNINMNFCDYCSWNLSKIRFSYIIVVGKWITKIGCKMFHSIYTKFVSNLGSRDLKEFSEYATILYGFNFFPFLYSDWDMISKRYNFCSRSVFQKWSNWNISGLGCESLTKKKHMGPKKRMTICNSSVDPMHFHPN